MTDGKAPPTLDRVHKIEGVAALEVRRVPMPEEVDLSEEKESKRSVRFDPRGKPAARTVIG